VVEHSQLESDSLPPGTGSVPTLGPAAGRSKEFGIAVAVPSLGFSYYKFRVSESNQVDGTTSPALNALHSTSVNQLGVTFGQSIGRSLVIASTTKLLIAGDNGAVVPADDPLGAAEDLDIDSETHFDLDLGVMVSAGALRFGVSLKNLFEPDFGQEPDVLKLERRARGGVAFIGTKRGFLDSLTIAADSDLTTTQTVFGDSRRAAIGGEAVLWGRHVSVRGGASRSTVGDARESWSWGGSVAPLNGVYIDVSKTTGESEIFDGWTTGVRLTF
jgi:hypothetical protein